MGKKKKSKRDQVEFPDLDEKMTTKRRRDFIDNRHYVNGVKHKNRTVMPALDVESKKFLNQFNKEFYGASFDSKFDYDQVHVCQVDEDTIIDIKTQIKKLKRKRKKIFDKSPNTTTEEDRDLARHYNEQIEEMEVFLNTVHPRRACEQANYRRNTDFINVVKASNTFDLVSWEQVNQDYEKSVELSDYISYEDEIDEDDELL
jgi:hypothetical protein